MAELVQSYRTADGKVFKTEAEAAAHEKYLEVADKIEGFIDAHKLSKKAAGSARNLIPAYLAYTGQ